MKLSTHPDDPGYRHNARLYTVMLDGVAVRGSDLIMADDDAGIVVTLKHGRDGRLITAPDGDPVTVIRKGKVSIREPRQAPEEVPFG